MAVRSCSLAEEDRNLVPEEHHIAVEEDSLAVGRIGVGCTDLAAGTLGREGEGTDIGCTGCMGQTL